MWVDITKLNKYPITRFVIPSLYYMVKKRHIAKEKGKK